MGSIQMIVASLSGAANHRPNVIRAKERKLPACEPLEGRALLNAGWVGGHAHGMWAGTAGASGNLDSCAYPSVGRIPRRSAKGHLHDNGFTGTGTPGHGMPALSAQAQADLQSLQTDVKTLQSEIPSALQNQLAADKATIDQALSSLTPAQRHADHQARGTSTTPPSDPITALTDRLKAANVSSDKITQITTDLQNYQSALQTVDSTLYAKVQSDQAALSKDLPTGHHPGPRPAQTYLAQAYSATASDKHADPVDAATVASFALSTPADLAHLGRARACREGLVRAPVFHGNSPAGARVGEPEAPG